MSTNYVIIGTGVAAVTAAKAIRDYDAEGTIHIYGAEEGLPYNRIKLSKDLFADLHADKVLIKKEKWFEKQQVVVISDKRIEVIHPNQHTIETSDGERISYDKLLICAGSNNRKLTLDGIDKQGVFCIRERHEADAFKAYIEDKEQVAIIGGGIQGLETAWSLHKAGQKVTILEVASRLMANQLDEEMSAKLKAQIESFGINVVLQATIQEIVGNEAVTGIKVNNEVIPCDSISYAIGITPNIALAVGTEIQVNRGIQVNDCMETSVADIYAAGDITEWKGTVEGLWDRAMAQGAIAGQNMATGATATYNTTIPLTLFNAFDLNLFSMGCVDASRCDKTLVDNEDKYTRLFLKKNQIVGVISQDTVVASAPYKAAIISEASVEGLHLDGISIAEVMAYVKNHS
ncbi:FAD-dependent oxidoreductase [Paenibacillus sp. FSL R10-2734]|uniref:NAD(P)/FAD-dependent oxidoreductase n=1 Tax=Paenibacillus sp. FSL R10-2734 TaxID=2954691 RepID=UPI0030D7C7B2